jgi:uncharacterized protein YciI
VVSVYFLVLLQDLRLDRTVEHEPFIDSLIERNLILLGGPFVDEPEAGVESGYILRCESRAEAEAIVATDPLVAGGAVTATISPWDLIGINTGAIDPDLLD